MAFALALPVMPVRADVAIDLNRMTPVPADKPVPTQDFFRPRALAQPVLNRAGTHIAAVAAEGEDKQLLMVYEIATAKVESLGSRRDQDIYNVNWLGNARIVFQAASRKMFGLGIMAADVGKLAYAYPLQQYSASHLISIPLKDPLRPLVWNRSEFETNRDVGVVVLNSDVRTGAMLDLSAAMNPMAQMEYWAKVREQNDQCVVARNPRPPGPGLTYGFLADRLGELGYAFTSHNGNLTMYRLDHKQWLPCPVDLEAIEIYSATNEDGRLFVRGPAHDGKPQPLQLMDAATGKLGETILQDALYDFNGSLYRNPGTGDVLGTYFETATPHVVWFNEQYRALQKVLDGMFPKQVVRIVGNDDQHRVFLVSTRSDRQPLSYHWVNLETRKAGLFKNSAPWIDAQRMRPMGVLSYKTRDGAKLDAYLTLPADAAKDHPAPLVVLCHGGPWARDSWGFDGEVQFLAHHGYAVLQPNYRGSTGSVGRFPPADKYDFVKMHDDATDAVRAVLRVDGIDKNRVAIMGGSFGGYLAISGVAHEPDLYRCAVSIAGVFDWAMQVQSDKHDQYELPSYGRMIKVLGDPAVEVAKYEAMSPIRHVQNIHVPVFVAGGKDDTVVELGQSRKLLSALDDHHVPYEKYFVGGEGHGMAYLKNQVELYDRILAFLDKHLQPR